MKKTDKLRIRINKLQAEVDYLRKVLIRAGLIKTATIEGSLQILKDLYRPAAL